MKLPKLVRSAHRRDLIVEPLESRITPGTITFPNVISIDRQAPAGPETGVSSVVYRVTFDQSVNNVDAGDFDVVTTGNAKADAAVSVAAVSGTIYDVTVSGVQGNGDLQLNLVDNGSIFNSSEGQLGGAGNNNGSFTGEIYQVLQTHPTVSSIAAVPPNPTAASTVSWTVTFNEAVAGVDATDFVTVPTGLTAPNAPTVTPINPSEGFATSYTVTVSGLVGTGTIGLNLADNETIRDADDNPLRTSAVDLAEPVTVGETGSGPVSVVSGDINGDGRADLAIANRFSNTVSIALGTGDGRFQTPTTVVTSGGPRSVALADVNGDGRPDLVVAASSYNSGSGFHTVNVLLNDGAGGFLPKQDFGSGFSPRAVAVGDLNGDGNPDIAVTDYASPAYRVQVLLGNGNGTFQSPQNFATGSGANSIAIGDLNGDGIADVVTANYNSGNVSVLLGTGTGSLGAHTTFGLGFSGRISPTGVAIGDISGDGRPDLAVSGQYYYYDEGNGVYTDGTVTVLLGNGDGTFGGASTTFAGEFLSGVAITDFDGNGRRDILATDAPAIEQAPPEGPSQTLAPGAEVFIFRNNGNGVDEGVGFGTFGVSLEALAIADFDGDGKPDVSVVGDFNYAATLLNEGTGNFTGDVFSVVAPFIDLAVTNFSDGVGSAAPGAMLTFTIDYQNLGTTDATGVKITVPLGTNLNFVAADNTGWTQNGNTLERVIAGTLGPSATGTETLKLRVNSTITAFSSAVGVTATISDDGTHGEDSNSGNNSQSDFDLLTGLTTDLTVTSIEDPRFAVAGNINYFTVHFSNIGNQDAEDASITVTLPANSFFFSFASDSRWSMSSGSGSITVTNLDVPAGGADQTISYAIGFFVPQGDTAPLSTTAEIFGKPNDNSENDSVTEETPVYHGFVVTSPGVAIRKQFAPPILRVFDKLTGEELFTITAYEEPYRDSIRVALGDFNFDGVDDIVTTTMRGTGRLRIFDGQTGDQLIEEFAVFDGVRDRGAFVAVGSISDFGRPEIVVGTALGGGKVRVYSFDGDDKDALPEQGDGLPTLELIKQYTPFGAGFRGGVRVATGDVDGFPDKQPGTLPEGGRQQFVEDDIIVGQGFFGGRVKVFKGATDTILGQFKVGGAGFRGGVSVGAADIDQDGHADIVVGRNTGRPTVVEVFDGESILDGGTATRIGQSILPFDSTYRFGVRVAAADVNGDGIADIIASVGIKNNSVVKFYDGADFREGTVTEITDRRITAFSEFPNVALWVAASRGFSSAV